MENEVQSNSTSEAQVAPQEAAHETPKPKSWLVVGLAVLVLLLLGTTGYLAYQNYQLKQEVTQKKPTPTPLPEITKQPEISSPTPTIDPTTNWETYEYPDLKFKIKFPQGWTKRGSSTEPPYWYDAAKDEKIIVALGEISFWEEPIEQRTIDITTFDLNNPNHRKNLQENLDTASSVETIEIGEKDFKKYNDVAISIAPNSTKNFTYLTLEKAGLGAKIMIGDRLAGSDLNEDLIHQILSTFQFLD